MNGQPLSGANAQTLPLFGDPDQIRHRGAWSCMQVGLMTRKR